MANRRTSLVVTFGLAAALMSCFELRGVEVVDGWSYSTPYPLAPGTVAVALSVEELPRSLPPNTVAACMAALSEATIRYERGGSPPIRYVQIAPIGGAESEVKWTWPYGFSARDRGGRLEIVAPDGSVFTRDGDFVSVGGGFLPADNAFHVCIGEWLPRRVMPL